MPLVVTQFGFSNGSGLLANIGDDSLATSWSPLATQFETYSDQFFIGDPVGQVLNVGGSFPHVQLDQGEPKRVPAITFVTGSVFALGAAVIIGSDNPSTSLITAMQTGDIFLGEFTTAQMNSGRALDLLPMKNADIRKRYIRILQRSSASADAPASFPANTYWYDSGSGNFEVPEYSTTFVIELWGGGPSGGASSVATDGGDTTCSTYGLTAEGGNKASTNFPNAPNTAVGGVGIGGNTLNLQGDPGGSPSTFNGSEGYGGPGGGSPFGGVQSEGARLEVNQWDSGAIFFTGSRFGHDGNAPGGAGSGSNIFIPSAGGVFSKYPGGSGAGYVKHVLTRGIDGPEPLDLIAFAVGNGGATNAVGGKGAQGRAKFSWT